MLNSHFHKWPMLLVFLSFFNSFISAQVTEQWVARYNGPEDIFDGGHALTVDAFGNVFVTGQSVNDNTGSDFVTIKYDANGNELWVRRYNSIYNRDDGGVFIGIDVSGNVYVTGWSIVNDNLGAFTTIRYDPMGNEVWARHYIGPGNFRNAASSLGIDASGSVYVTGVSTGVGSGDDYLTIKYNAAGNELWVRRYNGPGNASEYPHSMAVTASGNVYVTGESVGSGSSTDYATIKYDANGNEQWVRRYNGPANSFDGARYIILDGNENVYITGESFGIGTDYDFATIKYNSVGNEIWVKRYNSPYNFRDQGISLGVDAAGNVYVTGGIYLNFSMGSDYATVKYDAAGNEQWARIYDGPNHANDVPRSFAVDGKGNSYVTGVSVVTTGGGDINGDYLTLAYNTAGTELWSKRYNGPGNYSDEAVAIVVDFLGNIYITGNSQGDGSDADFATIKYRLTKPLKVDAGEDKTVYLGYGSNCVTLTAKPSDGNPPYKYAWSPGGVESSGVTICPSATTTYTVIVTDAAGNIASDQVMVTVIDARCENNKVLVCHDRKKLCIATNAVEAHLKHGDQLGTCSLPPIKNECSETPLKVFNTPNPFTSTTRLQYELCESGWVIVKVFDGTGRLISTLVNAKRKSGVYSIDSYGSNLDRGVYYYFVSLITDKKIFVKTGKMIKVR